MLVSTAHLFREDGFGLSAVVVVEAIGWVLAQPERRGAPALGWRVLRGPVLFVAVMHLLLFLGLAIGDVRAAELLIAIAGAVIPTVAVVRARLRPDLAATGVRGTIAVFLPMVAVAWLITRAFVVPSIACAHHLVDHAEVHRQWALEYRAILELESIRSEKRGESRMQVTDVNLVPESAVEILEAEGPPDGWAYTATPRDCDGCRSYYLDSNDMVRWARRRRATAADQRVAWNELNRLRHVIENGCMVLGDYPCR